MGQEHVIDPAHLIQRQITHPRTGVDQHVRIDQEGRGTALLGNRA
jgi:hypothetical protein